MTSFLLCNRLHLSFQQTTHHVLPTWPVHIHHQIKGILIYCCEMINKCVCVCIYRYRYRYIYLKKSVAYIIWSVLLVRKNKKTMEVGVEMRSCCWETGLWMVLVVMMRKSLSRFDELGELVSDLVSVVLSAIRFSRVMALRLASPSSSVAAARYPPWSFMAARHGG